MELLNGIIGKLDANEIIKDRCYIALRAIADVIKNQDLSDVECFQAIEEIICILEDIGSTSAGRHDFL